MTTILDECGQPFLPIPDRCPKCGSREKDHEEIKSFGGHCRLLCTKCGQLLKEWRE